jgi:hypothetical protein
MEKEKWVNSHRWYYITARTIHVHPHQWKMQYILRELTEHALMSWQPHNSLPLSKSVDWNTPPPSLLWNISVQNKVSIIL